MTSRSVNRRISAFSLLEVILALAILAGALAALGEVMRLGSHNATAAADGTQAEMLAESVMSELLVGARPLSNVTGAALGVEADPPWIAAIEVQPTEFQEIVAVRVTVAQQLPPQQEPARCELVRWFTNPDYLAALAQQQQQAQSDTSSTSSSSASTGASSSGGTTGQQTGGQR